MTSVTTQLGFKDQTVVEHRFMEPFPDGTFDNTSETFLNSYDADITVLGRSSADKLLLSNMEPEDTMDDDGITIRIRTSSGKLLEILTSMLYQPNTPGMRQFLVTIPRGPYAQPIVFSGQDGGSIKYLSSNGLYLCSGFAGSHKLFTYYNVLPKSSIKDVSELSTWPNISYVYSVAAAYDGVYIFGIYKESDKIEYNVVYMYTESDGYVRIKGDYGLNDCKCIATTMYNGDVYALMESGNSKGITDKPGYTGSQIWRVNYRDHTVSRFGYVNTNGKSILTPVTSESHMFTHGRGISITEKGTIYLYNTYYGAKDKEETYVLRTSGRIGSENLKWDSKKFTVKGEITSISAGDNACYGRWVDRETGEIKVLIMWSNTSEWSNDLAYPKTVHPHFTTKEVDFRMCGLLNDKSNPFIYYLGYLHHANDHNTVLYPVIARHPTSGDPFTRVTEWIYLGPNGFPLDYTDHYKNENYIACQDPQGGLWFHGPKNLLAYKQYLPSTYGSYVLNVKPIVDSVHSSMGYYFGDESTSNSAGATTGYVFLALFLLAIVISVMIVAFK